MQHEKIIVVVIERCCTKNLCKRCALISPLLEAAILLWYLKQNANLLKSLGTMHALLLPMV